MLVRSKTLLAASCIGLLATACQNESLLSDLDPSVDGPSNSANEDDGNLAGVEHRMAYLRVQLLQSSSANRVNDGAELRGEARFVESHGLDSSLVRLRSDFPMLFETGPEPTLCWSGNLGHFDQLDDLESAEPTDLSLTKELSYLDVGELKVSFADREIPLSLELIPDLLPYLSGVLYQIPSSETLVPDSLPDGSIPLTIQIASSVDYSTRLPAPIESLSGEILDDEILVQWSKTSHSDNRGDLADAGSGSALLLSFFARDDDPSLAPVHCRVEDRNSGKVSISLDELRSFDLDVSDGISMHARRIRQREVEMEDFPQVEVWLESAVELEL